MIQEYARSTETGASKVKSQEKTPGKRRNVRLWCGVIVIAVCWMVAVLADFLAPQDYKIQSRREPLAPASIIILCRRDESLLKFGLCLVPQRLVNPLERSYAPDKTALPIPLHFFPRNYAYKLVGFIPFDRHLFGADANSSADTARVYLLGTDHLGRDRFSRLLVASRFSLIVGPAGTLLASLLGITIGCWSGYSGRLVNALLMRAADVVLSLPAIIIILAARAIFPLELPPLRAAFLLISIFTVVGWAEMARLTNGLVLALRQREFVVAAQSIGLTRTRVLFRHILPNVAQPIMVQIMLMLPAFLLAETTLSFLGVGLQEPEPSWGNMLAEARDFTLLRAHFFLPLTPALAIMLVTLSARLIYEGLSRPKKVTK